MIGQLDSRKVLSSVERAMKHRATAFDRAIVEPRPAIVVGVDRVHPRCAQRQHPADVVWRHEVPGRTEHVRAENRAVIERLLDVGVTEASRTQAEGPFRRRIVVRLDASQPRDELSWRGPRMWVYRQRSK